MLPQKQILIRFGFIFFIMVALFGAVVYKIFIIQTLEKEDWMKAAQKSILVRQESVEPNRGNIFSSGGLLMASTIPYYHVIMDTRVAFLHTERDTFYKCVDSLAICLARKFNDRTAEEYRSFLVNGYRRGEGRLFLHPKRVSYSDLKEIKKFPILRWGAVRGGLIADERLQREKPFGSLASRTIGDIYGEKTPSGKFGRYGIEMKFDSLLQGTPGVATVQKVANKRIRINKVEPIDGLDLTTTIDIEMQDIAEKALSDMLRKIDAQRGCAILMETKTGEVRACVNLQRQAPGEYGEDLNMAVGDMSEPGSTFKTLSLMVAMEDGLVSPTDSVETFDGVYKFHSRQMRDHNYQHGGYGKITIAQALAYSSNIGISRVIEENYGRNPAKFVDKLYKMGLNRDLKLEIPGAGVPNIRHPKDTTQKWSGIDLPWMSIGYVLQIPPIYTLTYYNAIANGGKMIRPFFVKNIMKNGKILEEFETETINPRLCSPSVLKQIQAMLEGVVEFGTGKEVKSEFVRIAGKTGTAQLNYGRGEKVTHQVSFCGYFPAENPQYTAIVVIREPRNGYASGGAMSGAVFKNMAEQIFARKVRLKPSEFAQRSGKKSRLPEVKKGNGKDLKFVLKDLRMPISGETSPAWLAGVSSAEEIRLSGVEVSQFLVPNVVGMGAKDAVFLLEKVGLNVRLQGFGKVVSQSIQAGTTPEKGNQIFLELR